VKFVFWIRAETSNAVLLSTKQIESWDDARRIRQTSTLKKKNTSRAVPNVERCLIGEAWNEVLFHADHKHRPDIHYSGSIKL